MHWNLDMNTVDIQRHIWYISKTITWMIPNRMVPVDLQILIETLSRSLRLSLCHIFKEKWSNNMKLFCRRGVRWFTTQRENKHYYFTQFHFISDWIALHKAWCFTRWLRQGQLMTIGMSSVSRDFEIWVILWMVPLFHCNLKYTYYDNYMSHSWNFFLLTEIHLNWGIDSNHCWS